MLTHEARNQLVTYSQLEIIQIMQNQRLFNQSINQFIYSCDA